MMDNGQTDIEKTYLRKSTCSLLAMLTSLIRRAPDKYLNKEKVLLYLSKVKLPLIVRALYYKQAE